MLGLSSAGQGAANLLREGECTLNFPSADLWPQVERIARTTGRNPVPDFKVEAGFVHAADKFTLGSFTPQDSDLIAAPRVAECPLQFEAGLLARRRSVKAQRDVPSTHLLLEVEVRRVHAHRQIVAAETSHIDTGRWNPLFYVSGIILAMPPIWIGISGSRAEVALNPLPCDVILIGINWLG